jgi:hypothetical protein
MSGEPEEPKPKRRRFWWGLVAVVLIAAVVVGILEGPLWAEMSYAANETFPDDTMWGERLLRVDVDRNLKQYELKRLVYLLHSPSERWKGVAMLAIAGYKENDPQSWKGIAPTAVEIAASASNHGLRKLSLYVVQSVPTFEVEDAQAILATLGRHEISQTKTMVERIATRIDEDASPIEPVLNEWLKGTSAFRRQVAFEVLVGRYPESDPASAKQIREIFGDGLTDDLPWTLLHTLINRLPSAGETLLAGSDDDRRVLWRALTQRAGSRQTESTLAKGAEAAAVKELAKAETPDRAVVIRFLLARPNGLNILFQRIDGDDRFLSTLFEMLPSPSAASQAGLLPLGKKEADLFVTLLPRLKGDARARWGEWLSIAGRPGTYSRLFPPTGGPIDKAHEPTFAKMLANEETALWVQSYFEHVMPLPESAVKELVPMLRKGLKSIEGPPKPPTPMGVAAAGGGGGRRRAGISSGEAFQIQLGYVRVLANKFSKHPDVAAFLKDFPVAWERVGGPVTEKPWEKKATAKK